MPSNKLTLSILFLVLLAAGGLLIVRYASPAGLYAKLDEYINSYVKRGQFSGAVLVAKDGKIILSKGYGMANYELDVPNSPQTKFRLASVSKQFAAIAIVQLQEKGLLNSSDSLSKYIPDYPRGDEITIQHLLNHKSGVANFTSFPDYEETKMFPTTLEQSIERFKNKPLNFEPGEKYRYSNSGYILLTYIIEKVSGQTYEDYVQDHIFTPLGMNNSGYDHHATVLKNRASGYEPTTHGLANADYIDMSIPAGAGSLYSTVEDLYIWDRALYTNKVVQKSSFNNIIKSLVSDPIKDEYSYGWILDHLEDHPYMWHNGGIEGFHSHISRYINDDLCIIILSNFQFAPVEKISRALANIVLGKPYELPKQPVKIDPELYNQYEGEYQLKFEDKPDMMATVTKENSRLFVKSGRVKRKTFEFFPSSETEFFGPAVDARITFIKDEKGEVNQVIFHLREGDIKAIRIQEEKSGTKRKTMNKTEATSWPLQKKEITANEGIFSAHDKQKTPIYLEWKIRNAKAPDFANISADIANVSANAFTSVEVSFLQAYPDVVQKDEHFKAIKPLFKNGPEHVDWERVKNNMHETIEQIFLGDFSMLDPNWLFIFVEAKNKDHRQLGAIQFLILPQYADGDIKVTSIAVQPEAQGKGIGRLLMSTIFKIIPGIKRIFLNTRITNRNAINAYQAWGFVKDTNPTDDPFIQLKEHWINLEYKTSASDRLQKTAEQMIDQNPDTKLR
ncbi:GNAT family N-acetyltransferase [Candidatus Dependentiae bacterium]